MSTKWKIVNKPILVLAEYEYAHIAVCGDEIFVSKKSGESISGFFDGGTTDVIWIVREDGVSVSVNLDDVAEILFCNV